MPTNELPILDMPLVNALIIEHEAIVREVIGRKLSSCDHARDSRTHAICSDCVHQWVRLLHEVYLMLNDDVLLYGKKSLIEELNEMFDVTKDFYPMELFHPDTLSRAKEDLEKIRSWGRRRLEGDQEDWLALRVNYLLQKRWDEDRMERDRQKKLDEKSIIAGLRATIEQQAKLIGQLQEKTSGHE